MKKTDIPQDKTHLTTFTREVVYAQNENGKYEKNLSQGWSVKNEALNNAWENINEEIEEAKTAVKEQKKSPIYYYMKLKLMDIKILSSYTGIGIFKTKRHLKSSVFKKLKKNTLQKYANTFEINVKELTNFEKQNQSSI